MALSTTPIPPMRADWMASGACTSGSTARPRGAMRRASGGATTTCTTSAEPSRATADRDISDDFRALFPARFLRRLGAAVCGQRSGDDRLAYVHVGDRGDAHAGRLDDVDGVDADARTDVARRRGVVPRHVGRDDGSDDAAIIGANAEALPPGRRQDRRGAPGSADRAGGRGVLLRVERVRNGGLAAGRRAGGGGDAAAGGGARRADRGRCGRADRRRAPVHGVEGTSPCLLPGGTGVWPYVAGGRRHGLATRPAPLPPLQLLACRA